MVALDGRRHMSRCPNCSAELTQEYCPVCGQRRIRPDDLSARRFFQELFDEFANLRLTFKTVRTLRGLLTPGWLTAEYLAGRRQAYLTPFKVYLVCAAIFFLSAPLAGFRLASLIESDRSGTVGRLVSARVADDDPGRPLFNARFDVRVQSVYTIALGIEAIVLAVMLHLLFRKQHRLYGAHLIFALHYVAFMYLLTIGVGASRRLGVSTDLAATVGYALLTPYLVLALKRVYSESTGAILLKAVALIGLIVFLNGVANFVAIRLTLALA
jgi:Protein of unknown function (DUF3667)